MRLSLIYNSMILPIISNEQKNIINTLKNNNNIIVDSVAGSGKTTTNLYIAKEFHDKNILLYIILLRFVFSFSFIFLKQIINII